MSAPPPRPELIPPPAWGPALTPHPTPGEVTGPIADEQPTSPLPRLPVELPPWPPAPGRPARRVLWIAVAGAVLGVLGTVSAVAWLSGWVSGQAATTACVIVCGAALAVHTVVLGLAIYRMTNAPRRN